MGVVAWYVYADNFLDNTKPAGARDQNQRTLGAKNNHSND